MRAGDEDGELGEYRRKLAHFLQMSASYSAEKLLVQLRHDCKLVWCCNRCCFFLMVIFSPWTFGVSVKLLVCYENIARSISALYEERAMLLGRLKRHEQALTIYTNVLKDYKAAENYCNVHYRRDDPENSKVKKIIVNS